MIEIKPWYQVPLKNDPEGFAWVAPIVWGYNRDWDLTVFVYRGNLGHFRAYSEVHVGRSYRHSLLCVDTVTPDSNDQRVKNLRDLTEIHFLQLATWIEQDQKAMLEEWWKKEKARLDLQPV